MLLARPVAAWLTPAQPVLVRRHVANSEWFRGDLNWAGSRALLGFCYLKLNISNILTLLAEHFGFGGAHPAANRNGAGILERTDDGSRRRRGAPAIRLHDFQLDLRDGRPRKTNLYIFPFQIVTGFAPCRDSNLRWMVSPRTKIRWSACALTPGVPSGWALGERCAFIPSKCLWSTNCFVPRWKKEAWARRVCGSVRGAHGGADLRGWKGCWIAPCLLLRRKSGKASRS